MVQPVAFFSIRQQRQPKAVATVNSDDFRVVAIHGFDDLLEQYGAGARFERWRMRLTEALASRSHDEYAEALQTLGTLLGYKATRPRYGAATDCRWRGLFGNHREAVTWEAKIEQDGSSAVYARDVGQAHNQVARAETELGSKGYMVRGAIVTHLEQLDPAAAASIGAIKVIRKDAMAGLWARVNELLGIFAGSWSADVPEARIAAADNVATRFPTTGWLIRCFDVDPTFVSDSVLLGEW